MGIQLVSHVCFRVSDLERSLRFYRDVLGFEPMYDIDTVGGPSSQMLGREDVRLTGVWLRRDGFSLQLQQLHVDGLPTPGRDDVVIGYSHVAIRVSDLDEVASALAAAGADVLEVSRYEPAPGSAAIFVNDPDGIRLELVQLPGAPDSQIKVPDQD